MTFFHRRLATTRRETRVVLGGHPAGIGLHGMLAFLRDLAVLRERGGDHRLDRLAGRAVGILVVGRQPDDAVVGDGVIEAQLEEDFRERLLDVALLVGADSHLRHRRAPLPTGWAACSCPSCRRCARRSGSSPSASICRTDGCGTGRRPSGCRGRPGWSPPCCRAACRCRAGRSPPPRSRSLTPAAVSSSRTMTS